MNNNLKQMLMKLILENEERLKDSQELPLLYDFEVFNPLSISYSNKYENFKAFEITKYSNFKNVKVDILANIRFKIAQDLVNDDIRNWCEKLFRYCEIRYATLEKRAKEQKRSKLEIVQVYSQVISLLIEFHLKIGDLRYINLALKLMDYSWTKYPTKNDDYTSSQILYQRNLLFLDTIIEQLKNE